MRVALGDATDIPVVQVSLPGDSSGTSSVKLGQALGKLREQGWTVVCTGQVVHNLREFREYSYQFCFMTLQRADNTIQGRVTRTAADNRPAWTPSLPPPVHECYP